MLELVGEGEGSEEGDALSDVGAGAAVSEALALSDAWLASLVAGCVSSADGLGCVAEGLLFEAGFEVAGCAGDEFSAGDEGWLALLLLSTEDGLGADAPVG